MLSINKEQSYAIMLEVISKVTRIEPLVYFQHNSYAFTWHWNQWSLNTLKVALLRNQIL